MGCCDQRFSSADMSNRSITIEVVPGNALGADLDGVSITVHAQPYRICGRLCYAHYVRGSAGIHMKAYRDTASVMVIGGTTASFL